MRTYTELKGGIVFSFCDVVLPGARTVDCVYHAAEFSEDTVAHKFDYAAAVFGDHLPRPARLNACRTPS